MYLNNKKSSYFIFLVGTLAVNRSCKKDWDAIWISAQGGRIMDIPADIRIRCYSTLRKISADFAKPLAIERSCVVYYGSTGVGKSRRAWEELGMDAYPKDPRTKFWCGYQGQENVIVDEFRGGIDVGHILRWLDRYPVNVEIKGSSMPLSAKQFVFTSNLHPRAWYPELDALTLEALIRRMEIVELV